MCVCMRKCMCVFAYEQKWHISARTVVVCGLDYCVVYIHVYPKLQDCSYLLQMRRQAHA